MPTGERGTCPFSLVAILCLVVHLPVSQGLQPEDVHGLRVAGGTQELRVHTEHQGADCHVPRDGNTQANKPPTVLRTAIRGNENVS